MKKSAVVSLFVVAAIYEGLLGAAFLFAGNALFQRFQVPPPNHFGYIQFPALLLIVFAIMFLSIAKNPQKNRNLIPYGIGLKASYCGVIFFHWFGAGIPELWKPFAVCDLLFLILFVWAYSSLRELD